MEAGRRLILRASTPRNCLEYFAQSRHRGLRCVVLVIDWTILFATVPAHHACGAQLGPRRQPLSRGRAHGPLLIII